MNRLEGSSFTFVCFINERTRTSNKKYWFKFSRFLQMILDAKYPQLQQIVSIYDTKMMNHMDFSMINQVRTDVQLLYQNRKLLVKFGAFPDIAEQVRAPVNAFVAEEHDVQIINAPPRTEEPIKNVDLTGIESEKEIVFEETLMDDAETDENVGGIETGIETEGLTADVTNEDQTLSVNPHYTETFEHVSADSDTLLEDPTADLHPRKQS
ncbi:hypothetical protein HanRHA438_Chr04g0175691 [Helianthus annuus]|uniref:Uncharacterized protein n=1 Tax=Helianthus annuus TaxID=4232 RepID=A0A9K3J879_HELAN|nr:hypothetical protein HanXRQr2_Chr04g0166061 [Helianthus annuus]KAJ0581034.1 hypothetical protein HanHA300_Chr04g0136331 [Helianthus annuus]KAJ0588817.1 hypothetical protein HanIR_Chr04g0179101 [Helianthus annuus]KAJ0596977.1 hypothetical protein HanHA89_Chr04g0149251 [Helianthus annuus]KAJ0757659.1 hypothetical protein HanLR1_Chr04g0141361 [Helianthus annuus]